MMNENYTTTASTDEQTSAEYMAASFDDLLNHVPTEAQGEYLLSKEEYAAKKKAERDTVYALSDNAALTTVGSGEAFRQYLDVQSRFNRFSVTNALLVLAQNPNATRLGGFDFWKTQDGFVKTGQTGISILEPGKEYLRDDGEIGTSYNIKKVFDISQVNVRKLQRTPQYTEHQILAALVSRYPMAVTGIDELPDGLGAMTTEDTILVLRGMTFSDTFRAVAYEMVCAELEADHSASLRTAFHAHAATYMLCAKYGAETTKFRFDKAGALFADMDARTVKGELSKIRSAAENISERMAKYFSTIETSTPTTDEM